MIDLPPLGPQPLPLGITHTRQLIRTSPRPDQCLREKKWCYIGAVHPDLIFGAAMVHLGYVVNAFAYVFDRKTRELTEDSRIFPPLGKMEFPPHPEEGRLCFSAPNARLTLDGDARQRYLRLAFPRKHLRAEIQLAPPDTGLEARHFYMPMHKGNRAFTTKAAGLVVRGRIATRNKTWNLDDHAVGLLDWTHGIYPRRTQWNWACGAGISRDKRPLAFNFSRGVYEYGQLENTVWINGSPFPVGPVAFDYDPAQPTRPWRIHTPDNRVDLTFTPEGLRRKKENLGLVQSAFIQPCGRFQGGLRDPDNHLHTIKELSGVTEEHFALW
ncbi:MAG: DUF2804 domain-containing protein [Desulfobacterales bacterium]|nr:DUF2804 domain-containing protein [Desulfobacterales bacterium]